MKRSVWMLALLLLSRATSEVQAQTPNGYPWLVKAVSNATGKPIDPIGANTEKEALEQVAYLASFDSPGFSAIRYERNPQVGGPTPNRAPRMGSPRQTEPKLTPDVPRPGHDPAPRPAGLANSTFRGGETPQNYGKLEFRFGGGGLVDMVDNDGTTPGQYSISGHSVTLRFYDGRVVYTGTLDGDILHGSGQTNDGRSWTFSVRLQ